MSGFVASFRSDGVLRPSRRSCPVAERDGPLKGKSRVLPMPEQAASTAPKNNNDNKKVPHNPWRT
jgi:hypothetical protein